MYLNHIIQLRDVTTGATGATEVAPKFSYALTHPNQGGQILPTIAEVAANIFPWLRPCYAPSEFF